MLKKQTIGLVLLVAGCGSAGTTSPQTTTQPRTGAETAPASQTNTQTVTNSAASGPLASPLGPGATASAAPTLSTPLAGMPDFLLPPDPSSITRSVQTITVQNPVVIVASPGALLPLAARVANTTTETVPYVVTTIAGSGITGYEFATNQGTRGYVDGPALSARFNSPLGIAVDNNGNIYVSEFGNNAIRKISTDGMVSTLAGGTMGYEDGTGTNARFDGPTCIATDASGNVYVCDRINNRIRKVTPDGVVTTLAGGGPTSLREKGLAPQFADGTGTAALFFGINGITVDDASNVYVVDIGNHRVRKITPDGVVTSLAGSGESGSGGYGYLDGPAATAQFSNMTGLTRDSAGNLFLGDTNVSSFEKFVRKVGTDGMVGTVAGSGFGWKDGAAAQAQFTGVRAVVAARDGSLYISDNSQRIRRLSPDGIVTTIAGGMNRSDWCEGEWCAGYQDGTGVMTKFYNPYALALDGPEENLYVADEGNSRIRKITLPR